ncbi:hypothetical protein ABW19_dt0204166 [Dactylella cylindrospora]|nr:hypothetical protein ABW19_dt0204166 [Dactylella cylindrospora]
MSANTKLWGASPNSFLVTREVTDSITTFSVPFLRAGLIKFGGRATVAKLSSGGLLVFSPVPLTDDVSSTITALGGQVDYLVAPDMEHHMNLGPWKAAFPAARVIGPAELYDKRKKQGNEDVPFDFPLTAANKKTIEFPADFTADFDLEYFDGHMAKEVVLLHKPSRTVIEADLIFNTPSNEQYSKTGEDPKSGFFTKLAMHIWTTTQGKSQQRFIWYAAAKDKKSFNASSKIVDGWDFDRIIPCHGDVIETGAKSVFQRLFAWNIAAATPDAKSK